MPQALIRYNENNVLRSELTQLNVQIQELIAEAISTADIPLTVEDVDLIFEPQQPGSTGHDISIELKTIGHPVRRKKLTEQRVLQLKQDLLEAGLKNWMSEDIPLIWLQFTEGVHV